MGDAIRERHLSREYSEERVCYAKASGRQWEGGIASCRKVVWLVVFFEARGAFLPGREKSRAHF